MQTLHSLFKELPVHLKLVRTLRHFVNSTAYQFLAINESDSILYNIILKNCLVMTICLVSPMGRGEMKQNNQCEPSCFLMACSTYLKDILTNVPLSG